MLLLKSRFISSPDVFSTYHESLSQLPNLHAGGRSNETQRRVLGMGVHEPNLDGDVVLVASIHDRNRP